MPKSENTKCVALHTRNSLHVIRRKKGKKIAKKVFYAILMNGAKLTHDISGVSIERAHFHLWFIAFKIFIEQHTKWIGRCQQISNSICRTDWIRLDNRRAHQVGWRQFITRIKRGWSVPWQNENAENSTKWRHFRKSHWKSTQVSKYLISFNIAICRVRFSIFKHTLTPHTIWIN